MSRLHDVLSEDAAGVPIWDLLRSAADVFHANGGGPLEDRCRLMADAVEAAVAPMAPARPQTTEEKTEQQLFEASHDRNVFQRAYREEKAAHEETKKALKQAEAVAPAAPRRDEMVALLIEASGMLKVIDRKREHAATSAVIDDFLRRVALFTGTREKSAPSPDRET